MQNKIKIIINSNDPLFSPCSVLVSKCIGSSNVINNPYAELCFPDVSKYMNIKVFNLISRTNETHHEMWYKTCACKYRLGARVCNNKQ